MRQSESLFTSVLSDHTVMGTATGDRPPGLSACTGASEALGVLEAMRRFSGECQVTVYEANY